MNADFPLRMERISVNHNHQRYQRSIQPLLTKELSMSQGSPLRMKMGRMG